MSTVLVPAIFNWSRQNPEKNAADFPLADFLRSSSTSVAPAPTAALAPAPAPAPPPAPASPPAPTPAPAPAPAPASAPAPAPAHSSPSSVSDVLGGASSLAELDALTVSVTPALFNKCIISRFRCLSNVSHRRHVFAGRRNPVHHIVHHRRPEGGRGEGDDNEAEGTIVPRPTDPPGRLQGFSG